MDERIRVLVIAPILLGAVAGVLSKTLVALEHGALWSIVLFFCVLELWVQFMFVPYWKRRNSTRKA